MVDRSYKNNLKKTVILGLTQPGKTIEQIRQWDMKYRNPSTTTWDGDGEQEKYRELPIWHSKGEIDAFVIKQLNVPDEVVNERFPSRDDFGQFYMDVVHDITELRNEGSLTDWKHGSGIWRLTHSDKVKAFDPTSPTLESPDWRNKPITDPQIGKLRAIGLESKIKDGMTRGEASDLISEWEKKENERDSKKDGGDMPDNPDLPDVTPKKQSWIWSTSQPHWDIVKRKNVWSTWISVEKISQRVHPGDHLIFYVKQPQGEFCNIFECGKWTKHTERIWNDEDEKDYKADVPLKPIRCGNIPKATLETMLDIFKNPDGSLREQRDRNLVLKGNSGYPANGGRPISQHDYDLIFNLMDECTKDKLKPAEKKTWPDRQLALLESSEIKTGCKEITNELLIDEKKIIEIVTALASGRHVLLAGPIGTGKTHLAQLIPKMFWKEKGGYYAEDHTATSDWTTQDVIGGLFPKMKDGEPAYGIQNGCVVDTVSKNWEYGVDGGERIESKKPHKTPPYHGTWLIIDEFNRADIDKAFGQLFTSLRTGQLKIPDMDKSFKDLKIPKDFRIIGTLNTADKHFLFNLSDAIKSRFAYIELDIPKANQKDQEIYYALKEAVKELELDERVDEDGKPSYNHYITLDDGQKTASAGRTDDGPNFRLRIVQAYNTLHTVRIFKKLGTAILKSIYQNFLVGTLMKVKPIDSLDNALTTNLIPQLENLSVPFIEAIEAFHSDKLIDFIKTSSKKRNKEDYVKTIQIIAGYLHENGLDDITAGILVKKFEDGQLDDEFMRTYKAIQNVYDEKRKEFEFELPQLRRALKELKESKVI